MTAPLLHVSGVGKRFGGFVALDAINLDVAPGERLGLIGPNGSGKSTLVNCICGTLQNETGSVHFDGRSVDGMAAHKRTILGLARSFQLPRPFHSLSVADNLRIPLLYAVKARLGPAISSAERACRRACSRPSASSQARCRSIAASSSSTPSPFEATVETIGARQSPADRSASASIARSSRTT